VYNKIDAIGLELVDKLAREANTCVISCQLDLNIKGPGGLLERIWEELGMMRIYTKKRGFKPDFTDPLVVRRGSTIEDVAMQVHRSLVSNFNYALVWGKSSKFNPQPMKVSLNHKVADMDVISITTK